MKDLLKNIEESNILLEVVDGELKIFAKESSLDPILLSEIKENKAELIQLLQNNMEAEGGDSQKIKIPKAAPADGYPLSSSQHRLWIISQFEAGNVGYNIPGTSVFEGNFNFAALYHSFKMVIGRHEILRTVFSEDAQGNVKQYILDADHSGFGLAYSDFRSQPEKDITIRQLIQDEFKKPFNLATGPLLRAGVFQVTDNKWIFYYVMHHIISDGWSKRTLVSELLHFYNAYQNNTQAQLPPLRIQYKDYSIWQLEQLKGEAMQKGRSWWLKQFEGELPVLDLPGYGVRPALKTYNGSSITRFIDREVAAGIKNCSRSHGSTLFMGIVAAIKILLYKYTGQQDIIIGTPVAGRDHIDLEDQIGLYANTLAIRTKFNGADTYLDVLEYVRQFSTTAYKYQLYPFDRLVNDLGIQRDMGRNPLFDIQVIVQNATLNADSAQGQQAGFSAGDYEGAEEPSSVFDMVFNFIETEAGLHLKIVYNTDVYTRELALQLAAHAEQMLRAVIANPGLPIDQLGYLLPQEKDQLLNTFNGKRVAYAGGETLVNLFEKQATLVPRNAAVVFGDAMLTYRELNEKANALARYLSKVAGVRRGDLVAILLDRTEQMIIAILGILKAGAAYVPVDPVHPKTRKEFILRDTGVQFLVTQTDYLFELDYYAGGLFAIDVQLKESGIAAEATGITVSPDDLAYIIYTSGSTGEPNGVMISHGAVANSILAQQAVLKVRQDHRCLQFLSLSFDASVFEIFISLLSGAALYIINEPHKKDAALLKDFIQNNHIDLISIPPSYFKLLPFEEILSLKKVVTGGEQVSLAKVNALPGHITYYNAYGPTEASITAVLFELKAGEKCQSMKVPIGRPINNTDVYILDECRQLVPVGVTGEIYIGGAGPAKGYLNRPTLTRERFLPNPFRKGERMYKTGDLGRWLPDGNIEFTTRSDNQVKVRGYRIEPDEIAKLVQDHEDVDSAFVAAMPNRHGENELIAWFCGNGNCDVAGLKEFLARLLPAYMLPAWYVEVDHFPITANGKIDRKKLPLPDAGAIASNEDFVAPRTALEKAMATIWSEILEREKVGLRDNFFEMGGDSIKILRLTAAIRKELDMELSITDVYKYNSIESILAHLAVNKNDIEKKSREDAGLKATVEAEFNQLKENILLSMLAAEKDNIEDIFPMSDVERGMVYESVHNEELYIYHDQMVQRWIFPGFNIEILRQAIALMVERHPILRTGFMLNGPNMELQVVYRTIDHETGYTDLSGLSRDQQEKHIGEFMKMERQRPFRFSSPPLWRMDVFDLGEAEIMFIFQTHHTIIDGWSDASFRTELHNIYRSLVKDAAFKPAPLQSGYRDFVVQQEMGKRDPAQKNFWLNELADFTRLDLFGNEDIFERYSYTLRPAEVEKIHLAAANLNTTVKAISLTAYLLMLHMLGDNDDVLAGLVTNNRPDIEDGDKILGCFLNTIPFRIQVNGQTSFADQVAIVQQKMTALKDHEKCSILEISGMHRKQLDKGNPFFDVLFNYVDFHTYKSIGADSMAHQHKQERPALRISGFGRTNTVLDFTINTTAGGFVVGLRMTRKLKSGLNAENIAGLYCKILDQLISRPQHTLYQLELTSAAEKDTVLHAFNNTRSEYPLHKTMVQLFEEQVLQTPDNIAVICNNTFISYRQLNEKANRLGHYLRGHFHLQPDDVVAIQPDRNEWLPVLILGILKSGAAYLPIDTGYPQERVNYIVENSRCKLLMTAQELEKFKKEQNNYSAANPSLVNKPQHLAYVIYTSGSTGQPKGVMVEHRSLVNLCYWHNSRYAVTSHDIASIYAGVAFDASVWEFFPYMIKGAAVCMVPKEIRLSMPDLSACFEKNNITIGFLPTQVAEQFLETGNRSLRCLLTGGEKLKTFRSRPYLLVNNYGPTENTVVATCYDVHEMAGNIPIGKPISNTRIYILNRYHQLASPGLPGEICIAGASLARGYLHDQALTATAFVPDPFYAGEKMYRTGDLGRWLPDGNIEFLGRKDAQVKIRGYRIEPGEIESALQAHPCIDACVVLAKPAIDSEKELVAYIVSREKPGLHELRSFLGTRLPAYMIPAWFVVLDHLPLTANDKIDTKKLPGPDRSALTNAVPYAAPANEVEEKLAAIISELLQQEKIGVKDDFFESGGHSILAMKMVTSINRHFNASLTIKDLYNFSTVEGLAGLLTSPADQNENGHIRTIPEQESFIDINEEDLRQLPRYSETPGHILVTGATGFVGAYLLKELLDATEATIYCLVRETDADQGRQRLLQNLRRYNLHHQEAAGRVVVITGDLSLPALGIGKTTYETLAGKIDYIYHLAAHMDLMSVYHKMKPANVGSARSVVKLATTRKLKKLIYVSTIAIFSSSGIKACYENDPVDAEKHSYSSGYAGSKWVAEKIISTAIGNGLPAQIIRLGLITGDEASGKMPGAQWFPQLLQLCHDVQAYPEGYKVYPTPVDFVAKSICHLSLSKENRDTAFHLVNPEAMLLDQFFTGKIKRLPIGDWLNLIKKLPWSSFSQITALIWHAFNLKPDADYSHLRSMPEKKNLVSSEHTLNTLRKMNITLPPVKNFAAKYLQELLK